jgi:hypothetical protein
VRIEVEGWQRELVEVLDHLGVRVPDDVVSPGERDASKSVQRASTGQSVQEKGKGLLRLPRTMKSTNGKARSVWTSTTVAWGPPRTTVASRWALLISLARRRVSG